MAETNYTAIDFSTLSATDDGNTILYKDQQLCQSTSSLGDVVDSKILTKGYATETAVNNTINALSGTITADYATKNELGTVSSAVDELSGTVTANYATKEDLGKVGNFIVTEGDKHGPSLDPASAQTKSIYLILDDTVTGKDQYNEWVVTTGTGTPAWTCIGETTVDLSQYVTTSALNDTLTGYQPVSSMESYYTKSETSAASAISAALDLKEDKIFIAEYNVTPYADIKDAYDNGRQIICKKIYGQDPVYVALTVYSNSNFIFQYVQLIFSDSWACLPTGWSDVTHLQLTAGTDLVINNGEIGVNTNGTIGNSADMSFVAGSGTIASGAGAAAFGVSASAVGNGAFAEGEGTSAVGNCSHAEGSYTTAKGEHSYAGGLSASAGGKASFAHGYKTTAVGDYSVAFGEETFTLSNAFAEGYKTSAFGSQAHAEGEESVANSTDSHAEGYKTTANAYASHTEGAGTHTNDSYSHAEGYYTSARKAYAHSEGFSAVAGGYASHAEGYGTTALANYTHSQGNGTLAGTESMFAAGKFNATTANAAFVLGNGTASDAKSDAFIVDWNGKASATKLATLGFQDVEQAIKDIAAINTYEVVNGSTTADITNPTTKTIYLIKDTSVTGDDKYNEYICTNTATPAFEKIGDTSIDLSNYVPLSTYNTLTAKVQELETLLNTYSGLWVLTNQPSNNG